MPRWPDITPEERFWSKIDVRSHDECWNWTAPTTRKGYGRIKLVDRAQLAHRVAYELLVGPVPDGLELDHLCRNRTCVNPAHLEPVTHKENVRRGLVYERWATRTHCDRGHAYTPENTAFRNTGSRVCRQCRKDNARSWREAREASGEATSPVDE